MININAYLTFSGNCSEAMGFYKDCLGGELALQTIGESPMADRMPQAMKDCILHATLTSGALVIMGSDMVPEEGLKKGNAVSLMLNCSSAEELNSLFMKLSESGKVSHEPKATFGGATLCDLTDKYGNYWLLRYDANQRAR